MSTKIINNKPYTLASYCQKLVKYAFLIKVLALRELKIKYSRTFFGIGWLFLQPLVVVLVYSVFFNNIIKINTDNIPYPSFVFSGLVLWYIFTGMVSKGTYALVESADLINKVSFPRLIILIAKMLPVLLECAVLLVLLLVILLFTHQPMGLNALSSAFYFLQISIFSFSLGLLCSIVVVKYRDLGQLIPFVMNFGIWLTPVFYPTSLVPPAFQPYILYLNPLALSMEGLRGALFFNRGISNPSYFIFVFSLVFMLIAFYYFVKFERKLVENL